jgi:hypothetical protein
MVWEGGGRGAGGAGENGIVGSCVRERERGRSGVSHLVSLYAEWRREREGGWCFLASTPGSTVPLPLHTGSLTTLRPCPISFISFIDLLCFDSGLQLFF